MGFLDMVKIGFHTAWTFAPFPIRILMLIILAEVWLYVEYHLTSYARRIPGWQRAIPGLGVISEIALWAERVGKWLFLAWALVFFVLASGQIAVLAGGEEVTWLIPILEGIGKTWSQIYALLNGLKIEWVKKLWHHKP